LRDDGGFASVRRALMEKQSKVTGTVAVSVLTLCCSTACCAMGIYAVADRGRTVHIGTGAAIPMILLGILVWIVPPLIWSAIVADREDGAEDV
jgi:hypothetical protein